MFINTCFCTSFLKNAGLENISQTVISVLISSLHHVSQRISRMNLIITRTLSVRVPEDVCCNISPFSDSEASWPEILLNYKPVRKQLCFKILSLPSFFKRKSSTLLLERLFCLRTVLIILITCLALSIKTSFSSKSGKRIAKFI